MKAPTVGKDGKTPGLTPSESRRLLDAPDIEPPAGVRDPALLGVLAYTGYRVGELTRLRVRDYQVSGGHKVLRILGKGGKERTVPLHPEAFERLDTWLEMARLRESPAAPLIAASLPRRLHPGGRSMAKRPLARVGPTHRRVLGQGLSAYAPALTADAVAGGVVAGGVQADDPVSLVASPGSPVERVAVGQRPERPAAVRIALLFSGLGHCRRAG